MRLRHRRGPRAGPASLRGVSALSVSLGIPGSPSGCGSAAQLILPLERLPDDNIKICVAGCPAERAPDLFRGGHDLCRVTGPARSQTNFEPASAGALDRVDHLKHRKAAAVPTIENLAGPAGRQIGERGAVRARQIADLDVVADAGAIRGGIVGAKYLKMAAFAKRGLAGHLHLVGGPRGRLAGATLAI